MANIELLDRQVLNAAMEKRSTDEQPLYELTLEPNTLNETSTLRIKTMVARTVNPPSCLPVIGACGYECELGQYAQATYISSTEVSGPVIRTFENEDITDFYGVAAIYYPISQIIALVFFEHDPLSFNGSIGGTIVQSVSYTLISGDVLKVYASNTTATNYSVSVNGIDIITNKSILDATTTNPCITFITIDITDDGTETPVNNELPSSQPPGTFLSSEDYTIAIRSLVSDNLYPVPWDKLQTFSGTLTAYSRLLSSNMYGVHYFQVPLVMVYSSYHQFGIPNIYASSSTLINYTTEEYFNNLGSFDETGLAPQGVVGHIGYMQARISSLQGTPIFGIAILVQGTTPPIYDNFTGYVYVINTVTGVVEMRFFQNASLASHTNGTLLESDTFAVSAGSVLRVEAWSSYPTNGNFTGSIWVLSGQYASSETLSNAYTGSFQGGSVENAGDTRDDNTYALGNYAGIVTFPSNTANAEDSVTFDRVLWKTFTQWA